MATIDSLNYAYSVKHPISFYTALSTENAEGAMIYDLWDWVEKKYMDVTGWFLTCLYSVVACISGQFDYFFDHLVISKILILRYIFIFSSSAIACYIRFSKYS